jgi:signal transduction histidine kinase
MMSMKATESLSGLLGNRPVPYAGPAAVMLAAILVFIDWITWIELNESILFTLPLILCAAARDRRLLWGLTGILTATAIAVYFVQIPVGRFSLGEPFFINRFLSIMDLLLVAGLLHVWMYAVNILDSQARALTRQNEALEAAREEITLQNEELNRRRQEAEEASGRKTRLLTSVSHDIRSPLNTINMTAEIIRRSAAEPSLAGQLPGLTQRLQATAQRLAELVTDVLDLSALESGHVALHESEFSLTQLLNDECQRLLPLAEAAGLRLTAETARSIWLYTDRVKFARVLTNLVTNAIKFTKSGSVTIAAEPTLDGGVHVSVRDTGIGIEPENVERIFDEFAQIDHHDGSAKKGWGLGLPICLRLVRFLGGELALESELNRGTVFTISLPALCVVDRSQLESVGN